VLCVTAAVARQSQTPPPPKPSPAASPTATPQWTSPAAAPVTAGRSGMVVVERQGSVSGQRVGGVPAELERRAAITAFITPAGPTSWQNVKLEVKISDSLNTDTQHSKTMTVLCLDGNSSQVRSQSGDGLINIDARPAIRPDGRIYLQLILEYRPDFAAQTAAAAQSPPQLPRLVAGFSESLNLLVTDGTPIVVSQSADPRSDRKVTVEVTASVLK